MGDEACIGYEGDEEGERGDYRPKVKGNTTNEKTSGERKTVQATPPTLPVHRLHFT